MGGDAGVSSELYQGSTFWFSARLNKVAAPPVHEVADAGEAERILHEDFVGSRILLVEDEPINREIAQILLEDIGFRVDPAEDGIEALERVVQQKYDLILMDMQMPRMDGLEATRRIRAMPGGRDLLIIAMTANAFADDKARCLAAGMDDFATKPIDPDVFLALLLRNLQQRQPKNVRSERSV